MAWQLTNKETGKSCVLEFTAAVCNGVASYWQWTVIYNYELGGTVYRYAGESRPDIKKAKEIVRNEYILAEQS